MVNIVSANFFDVSFDRYAAVMVPVDLVSIATSLAVLWLYFGRRIPRRYPVDVLDKPASVILDPYVFRAALSVLAVLVAYFVLARWHVSFCVITGAGASVLLGLASRWWHGGRGAVLALGPVLRNAPWQIVLFSIGMYLVVYGLGQAGLTHYSATVLEWFGQQGHFVATLGTDFLAALVASVMNNMPSTLVGALAIK